MDELADVPSKYKLKKDFKDGFVVDNDSNGSNQTDDNSESELDTDDTDEDDLDEGDEDEEDFDDNGSELAQKTMTILRR